MSTDPDTAPNAQRNATPELQDVPYSEVVSLPARDPDGWLKYGADPVQFILQWSPLVSEAKGFLILIHGGCWLNSFDLNHIRPLASALAEQGYEVFAVEYRRTGDEGGGWPGTLADITAAIDTINEHSQTHEAILIGHSAGGHLALLAASQQPAALKAVIGLAAITNLSSYATGSNSCQTATTAFMDGAPDERPAAYQAAGLAGKTLHPRSFLLQGDADRIVGLDQAQVAGATTVIETGAGHFDWVHSGTAAYRTLLATLNELVD